MGTRSSEAQARQLAGEVASGIAAGALETPQTRPSRVRDLMDRYHDSKAAAGTLRPRSLRQIGWMAKRICVRLGEVPLAMLSRATVTGYVRARLAEGRAPETVWDEVRTLWAALRYAARRGWWLGDPAMLCAGHGLEGQGTRRWLRAEEAERLVDACTNRWHRIVVRIILGTGLRIGEVLHLRWHDWLPEEAVIRVRAKAAEGWRPKDDEARIVPVNRQLGRGLEEWRHEIGDPDDDRPMVPTRDGERRASPGLFGKLNREACDRAGVRRVSVHELRHTFATLWLQNGGDLFRLSKILGHYSPEFTARQYAHVCGKDLVQKADEVAERIAAKAREAAKKGGRKAASGGPVTRPVTRAKPALAVVA
jgi:integrase